MEEMIDKEAVTGALDAISDAINAQINALDGNDRGTVLANLTISLFRACEAELSEDSMDRLVDAIDEDDETERVVH